MKIAICSTYVPLIRGGLRNIVDWLAIMLRRAGHEVEIVYIPSIDRSDCIVQQMMAYRWIDLTAADRVICFRPQSHLIVHSHKIIWFIHHLRVFYDLWGTIYRGFPDDAAHRGLRDTLIRLDSSALGEAKAIFTNSRTVADRLSKFNNINSEVLYPPLLEANKFYCQDYNDEIVYICRIEHHKRQHLLIDAMQYTQTDVHLHISGSGSGEHYIQSLKQQISDLGLESKVTLENRWISEEEKIKQLSICLAAAYLPLDEDSYGYPSLEASHASKPILTTVDSGGVLELVIDQCNGYVTEASPKALAAAMDKLYLDRDHTKLMGKAANARLQDLNISWDYVLEKLLS